MQNDLYRKESLEALSSPERLDSLMVLLNPGAWAALAACLAAILAALAWSVFGHVTEQAVGPGILARQGGINNVVAPADGELAEILVQPRDLVAKGDALARIAPKGPSHGTVLRSPFTGTITELLRDPGERVKEGEPVMRMDDATRPVTCYLFIPHLGKRLSPGLRVEIEPAGIPREECGCIVGTIRTVSPHPQSLESVDEVVRNPLLARRLAGQGDTFKVEVDPGLDPGNPSGFRWTNGKGPPPSFGWVDAGKGPPLSYALGTLVTGRIKIRRQSPLSLVVPAFRKRLGWD